MTRKVTFAIVVVFVLLVGCGESELTGQTSSDDQDSPAATSTIDPVNCNMITYGTLPAINSVGDLAWMSHQVVTGVVTEERDPFLGEALNPEYSPVRPIYTDYTFEITDRIRGKAIERLRIRQAGGTIGDCTQEVDPLADLNEGDRLLLFLNYPVSDAEEPTFFITGGLQGYWQVTDQNTVMPVEGNYARFFSANFADLAAEIRESLAGSPPDSAPLPIISLEDAPVVADNQ